MLTLTAPHVPTDPHPDHLHESKAGAYGDVVQEIDANVGKLLAKLKALNLDKDTLVIVTSDNGPWFAGSSGSFRERKGGAGWDGGYRVPFIARQPGAIPAGIVNDAIAMNIDLMPTICGWAGKSPPNVTLDGKDIAPLLQRKRTPSPHEHLVLFNNEKVVGIRTQDWKLVTSSYYRTIEFPLEQRGYSQLVNLKSDPGENYDVSSLHPGILADMKARLDRARATYEPLGVRQTPAPAAPR